MRRAFQVAFVLCVLSIHVRGDCNILDREHLFNNLPPLGKDGMSWLGMKQLKDALKQGAPKIPVGGAPLACCVTPALSNTAASNGGEHYTAFCLALRTHISMPQVLHTQLHCKCKMKCCCDCRIQCKGGLQNGYSDLLSFALASPVLFMLLPAVIPLLSTGITNPSSVACCELGLV